jgi:hypothetical protein
VAAVRGLREIQGKLTYHEVWTAAESGIVGEAFSALVAELRKVAGGAMREAWRAQPITADAAMSVPTIIDLSH